MLVWTILSRGSGTLSCGNRKLPISLLIIEKWSLGKLDYSYVSVISCDIISWWLWSILCTIWNKCPQESSDNLISHVRLNKNFDFFCCLRRAHRNAEGRCEAENISAKVIFVCMGFVEFHRLSQLHVILTPGRLNPMTRSPHTKIESQLRGVEWRIAFIWITFEMMHNLHECMHM